MIPVTQTLFGREEGNCLAACVASILELDLADVPNFCAGQSDGSWLRRLADWLAERELCAVHASFVDSDPGPTPAPGDLVTMSEWLKLRHVGFAIISGYTERGLSHSTVWLDGEIAHDPHPRKNPLVNVVDMIVIAHRDPRGAMAKLVTPAQNVGATMDDYTRGLLDGRRAYAKEWADATDNEISALDFTPDRLRAELQTRWLERRCLADGTVPAVGQRVVTVREVAERWGLGHGHDDHVHEITSLLGGDCHLVECGPEQIGVGMLRLAPAGSDVTCGACRGWHAENERRRIDAVVFRETQFKVAELQAALRRQETRTAGAERDRDAAAAGLAEQRAEVERLSDMLIARQDAELADGPPSEMDLRLLHATREVTQLRARVEADDVEREAMARAVEALGSEWSPTPGSEVAVGWSKILRDQLHKAAAMIRSGKAQP